MHDVAWATDYSASSLVPASPEVITSLLADAPMLPSWNPALSSVSSTAEDGRYDVRVHGLLRGELSCRAERDAVFMTVAVPGLTEISSWILDPDVEGQPGSHCTLVTHRVRQRGVLTALIGRREAQQVPGKRLSRLVGAVR